MQKFFPLNDIKAIDRATIEREQITSVQLIDRAARALCDWIMSRYTRRKVIILAGPGNNGSDGLALALLLSDKEWRVELHIYAGVTGHRSADNEEYLRRIEAAEIEYDENNVEFNVPAGCLIVDALFGTGLNRPLEGVAADVVSFVNTLSADVISVDIPSGLGDESSYASQTPRTVVHAKHTVSFQFPKMAFFLPEMSDFVGSWHVCDIKLSRQAIAEAPTGWFYSNDLEAGRILKPRQRFAHKGSMGHAVLFAGSKGMVGASILASRGCMRSGVGLLTVVAPHCAYDILQTSVPEAMVKSSADDDFIVWRDDMLVEKAKAVGIGPGLGRTDHGMQLLRKVLAQYGGRVPIVIDADALFHLGSLLSAGMSLPSRCVLTPHPVEFDRLTEPHSCHMERIDAATEFARRHNVVVVLKEAFTLTALPDGRRIVNTTGNSGMATGGSGDVLTGVILGLLAQGYEPHQAAVLGVGLHAAAGDAAAEQMAPEAMVASDIVNHLGDAFGRLRHG